MDLLAAVLAFSTVFAAPPSFTQRSGTSQPEMTMRRRCQEQALDVDIDHPVPLVSAALRHWRDFAIRPALLTSTSMRLNAANHVGDELIHLARLSVTSTWIMGAYRLSSGDISRGAVL